MDWGAAAYRARRHIAARMRTVPERRSLELIDFFAEHRTVTADRMQQHGSADFVATILGHVTTAVHGKGRVPEVNGWYQRDEAGTGYVINPGFAVAWKAARLCDEPLAQDSRPGPGPAARSGVVRQTDQDTGTTTMTKLFIARVRGPDGDRPLVTVRAAAEGEARLFLEAAYPEDEVAEIAEPGDWVSTSDTGTKAGDVREHPGVVWQAPTTGLS